jgi:hypothetical protein
VQADSLSQAADELYALLPGDFTAARDEQAKQAKSAGQTQTAAQIKKLARPTASAWLVNQLVRSAAGQMDRLFELGQSLQDAQRELDGERMRELSGQRRQLIAELLPEATRLATEAGQPASATVLAEVRATLEAALADPAAGTAVRSGRLTRALAYAGLGEVDLTAAMAVLPDTAADRRAAGRGSAGQARAREARAGQGRAGQVKASAVGQARTGQREPGHGRAGQGQGSARGDSRAQRADEGVSAAEAGAESAQAAAAQAERRVASLGEQRQFLRRRIEHLQRELDQVTTEDAQLGREVKQAQRDLDAAARTMTAAQRRLAQARERAGPG